MRVELEVKAVGGAQALGRVVNILALLGLRLGRLTAEPSGEGLTIAVEAEGPDRMIDLCLPRIKALICVRAATLRSIPAVPPDGDWPRDAVA